MMPIIKRELVNKIRVKKLIRISFNIIITFPKGVRKEII